MTELYRYALRSSLVLGLTFGVHTPSWAQDATSGASLSWYPVSQLTAKEREGLPEYCRGDYRIPQITATTGDQLEGDSNALTVTKDGKIRLEGDAVLKQKQRILYGQDIRWDNNSQQGEMSGEVSLVASALVLQGEKAEVDQGQGRAKFYNAQYSIPASHLRGSAGAIEAFNNGQMNLKQAEFTFCEPGDNDWSLVASELHLDQKAGVGSAWHTRLHIADVPVLYVPYYRFPIGDQRMTGFLNPSLSISPKLKRDLGDSDFVLKDAAIPFYLNIAPNLDATITPHYVNEHGTLWENQLRHKTRWLGDGEANYATLSSDDTTGEKRWLMNYKQSGQWRYGFGHRWEYNQVSDEDYINDFNVSDSTTRVTQLPRHGEIYWNKDVWHADLTAEEFQTVDKTITLANRPYGRLPQLNLSYSPKVINALQFNQKLQATRFERKAEDTIAGTKQTLTGFAAINGERLLSDSSLSYPLEWPFAFLTPMAEYRYRSYRFYDLDPALTDPNSPQYLYKLEDNPSLASARYSLDGGLYFDREFSALGTGFTQTLEPRAFYVYSPYVQYQDRIPNFDSAATTISYSSLFTGERFTGGDRLEDLDQVSLGLTTRFIRDDGLEMLRLSAGQIFYNVDRRVQLTTAPHRYKLNPATGAYELQPLGAVLNKSTNSVEPTPLPVEDMQARSALIGEAELNPNAYLSLFSTVEWQPYQSYAKQERYGARFEDQRNHFLSLAVNKTQTFNYAKDEVKVSTYQLDTGAFYAFNDSWALFGRLLYDLKKYQDADPALGIANEARPKSPILESLIGAEYQNCCWRTQFSYRETSLQQGSFSIYDASGTDITQNYEYTTKKRYSFILSFQLKGLGQFGKNLDKLMATDIPGYSRRHYYDHNTQAR